jgi:hypothetical protein
MNSVKTAPVNKPDWLRYLRTLARGESFPNFMRDVRNTKNLPEGLRDKEQLKKLWCEVNTAIRKTVQAGR